MTDPIVTDEISKVLQAAMGKVPVVVEILGRDFTGAEVKLAITHFQNGKAQGPGDNNTKSEGDICVEILKYCTLPADIEDKENDFKACSRSGGHTDYITTIRLMRYYHAQAARTHH